MTDTGDALTPDETAELNTASEQVAHRAKATFSLKQALSGAKLAETKVVVFLDMRAAQDWAAADAKAQQLAAIVQAHEAGSDAHVRALQDFNEADDQQEALRTIAFENVLSIHMRAVPQVALEAAQRKARKELANEHGEIPDERKPELYRRQDEILLGHVVRSIVNPDGQQAEFDRATLHQELREALPVTQFARVIEAFNSLMFTDTLARAATSDPGF